MNTWSTRTVPGLAALVTAGLLLSACGAGGRPAGESSSGAPAAAEDVVGVTDTTIKVGAHYPLTGVAAPGYSEIPDGVKAYFDFVNAAGGIHGRQIEYIVRDDGYNPTNTSSVVNELVLKDEVFAIVGGLGTPTHSAVVDFLNDEGVPDLFVSSGSLGWGDRPAERPMTFGWQPDYEIEGKIIGQWIKENKPDARVGLFLQDDDLGVDGEKGVRRFLGDQIVETVRYTSGNTDVAPQLARLQAAKADLIIGFNTPSYTALTQLVSMKLSYQPAWFYSSIGSDANLVGALLERFSEGAVKAGGKALDGVYTTEYIPGVDSPDNEWTKLWQKVWAANGNGKDLTNYRIYGMSHAYAFVQALQAAGQDVTRENIVTVLEEKGATFDGPQLAPFRYSKDNHLGIGGLQVTQLKGGAGTELTKVLVTDLGDTPITEDTSGAAQDAPPASGIPGN